MLTLHAKLKDRRYFEEIAKSDETHPKVERC
jgi:hypothetical protein